MIVAVPAVEIANDADPLRVGRPDGETGPRHAVNRAQLRAELLIKPALIPFAKQIQVRLAERRQERIRIAGAADLTAAVSDDQIVGINAVRLVGAALEDAGVI